MLSLGAEAPPLAPELWNLVVVVITCGFVGWLLRLSQLILTLVDVRSAVRSEAVLQLRDLGPSLHVLEDASLWHFQQLLRTKHKVESTKMVTLRQPFEIPLASLKAGGTITPTTSADQYFQNKIVSALQLSFTVRSSTKCVVQVFWGVRTDALLQLQQSQRGARTTLISSPRTPGRSLGSIPVLHRLPAAHKTFGQRAVELPSILSLVRRQTGRHRLEDDDNERDDERCRAASSASYSLEHLFRNEGFLSASPPQRLETSGEHALLVEMPHNNAMSSTEEVQSLLTEVADSDLPPTRVSAAGFKDADKRYDAVVLVGTLASVGCEAAPSGDTDVLWQCVAIDLSPKAAVTTAPNAVAVVRQLTGTRTRVLEQQEMFGRGDSECVICLERAQAAVLLPCRHLCVCRPCLREIDRCPICRAAFSSYACFADADGRKAQPDSERIEVKIV